MQRQAALLENHMYEFLLHQQRGAQCGRKVTSGPGPLTLLRLVEEAMGITGSDSWAEAVENPSYFVQMKIF